MRRSLFALAASTVFMGSAMAEPEPFDIVNPPAAHVYETWPIIILTEYRILYMLNMQSEAVKQADMRKAIMSLAPHHLSMDTTPIEFSVDGVHYRVPRNYIESMPNWQGGPQSGAVTLRVNIPSLEPLNDHTVACFLKFPAPNFGFSEPDCHPMEIEIFGRDGPSADQSFKLLVGDSYNKPPMAGPGGFELYKDSPDSPVELYRKFEDGYMLIYNCNLHEVRGKPDGICEPFADRLSTGAVIDYSFHLSMLGEFGEIDPRIHRLIEGFSTP